ncbi:DUF4184 family protein [Microbacterium immunditiarum]|uniref:Cell wall anchor protein n=1 Tax=Microbacterium immunditiarum TaxID=337480 RepID=A0A7Y9KKD1_9MICO|nr:DUF4184 family protein [Microbacterium immunditiarum]NYE20725.1 hypothetical protein [Microbacterium immunditiarum]
MPFTPSHAVVTLPFLRTPLVPAAIAVGAMTPDLPLFVRGTPIRYGWTHDLLWLPATLVLALALLLVWRCALRPAVRELSPRPLAARLPREWDSGATAALRETFGLRPTGETDAPPRRPWVTVLLLGASLAIGVVSHIVWDLFTHEGRWGVAAMPALDEAWGPLDGYKWLQHGSSVVGLVILAVWGLVWLARRPEASVSRVLPGWVRSAWLLSLPAILVAALVIGYAVWGPFTAQFTPQHLAYRMLPPASAVWGVLTLALCTVVQAVRGVRRRAAVGAR